MKLLYSFLIGLLFGGGLLLAGMTDPRNVIAFLDVFGDWDGALALVMGGAVVTHALTLPLVKGWPALPKLNIDPQLIGGAALFGLGWGIGGFCPGPAIVAAGAGHADALLFVAAMVLGMGIVEVGLRLRTPNPAPQA